MWKSTVRRFLRCEIGNFAVILGCLLPVVLGAAGGAVDLFVHHNHRSELQATADAAVLAAATEATLKGWNQETASGVVVAIVEANLTNKFSGQASFGHKIEINQAKRRVDLMLTQDHYGYFYLGYFTGSPQIEVRASAAASGQSNICIIVQSRTASKAFALSGDASVIASDCSAYSNSGHKKGVVAAGLSKLTTELSCSGGGYAGGPKNFSPLPLTDCPPISDPLASRAATIDSSVPMETCSFTKLEIKGKKKSLTPGVYCGGIRISDGSTASLAPGIYVIKDGKLRVDGKATIEGNGVSLVFVGENAGLEFKHDSAVSLGAPEDGALAGVLIYARKSAGKNTRTFKIESQNARKFVGTVYIPGDTLIVGGDRDADGVCDPETGDDGDDRAGGSATSGPDCRADVGSGSSWTAIIANELQITNGANLVLNANYGATAIPVPDGLGPNSSIIYLAK